MVAESRHLDVHERIKRQGFQDLVKFAGAFNLEDADVGPFWLAYFLLKVRPLTLLLKISPHARAPWHGSLIVFGSTSCGMRTVILT